MDAAKAVRCPVCLNGMLPPGKLAQLLPNEQLERKRELEAMRGASDEAEKKKRFEEAAAAAAE